MSAFAVPINSDPASIFIFLAISRFVLGVGVGGVYPLSATIAAESSDKAARGRSSALVFSMQGVANLMVPLIAMLFLTMTDEDDWESWVDKDGNFSGLSWRLALGFGAIPGLLIAPFKTAETKKPPAPAAEATSQRTTSSSALTLSQALCMKEYVEDRHPTIHVQPTVPYCRHLVAIAATMLTTATVLRYWGKLLGCAGGWFLFDITFYGNTLFQSTVLKQVFDTNDDADDGAPVAISGSLQENVCAQMAVVAAIALPGYYVSAYFMDKLGRRNIQLMGFCVMAILFVILGVWVKELGDTPTLMLILYSLTFFFSNFGPNSTTFILPAETFPSNMRTTMNGFCAAMGKLGATIGSGAFKPLADATSLGTTMIVCGIVSVLGAIVTYFFVEDCRGKDMDGSTNDPVAVNGDSDTGDVYSPLPYAEA